MGFGISMRFHLVHSYKFLFYFHSIKWTDIFAILSCFTNLAIIKYFIVSQTRSLNWITFEVVLGGFSSWVYPKNLAYFGGYMYLPVCLNLVS